VALFYIGDVIWLCLFVPETYHREFEGNTSLLISFYTLLLYI